METEMMRKNEILILHGWNMAEMAMQLCAEAGLAELIGGRDKRIGLKPNLVVARPASEGATTHPEVVEGVLRYLKEAGFHQLVILEGSWVGERTAAAFRSCGYTALAEKYGAELIDTQQDSHTLCDCGGTGIELCDSALGVDFMINLPVMKGHCQTRVTCALKNNKGVIPNSEKRRFHQSNIGRMIAQLNLAAKNDFILVDAICGDLDFEEGGNPVPTGMLFAARDPVLCDAFAAQRMGYSLGEVPYIRMAEQAGVGSADLGTAAIRELNSGEQSGGRTRPGGKMRQLAKHIDEDAACSACYAALTRALSRMGAAERAALRGKVCVGQGFRGKGGGIGVGRCTAGFSASVPGCPPAAGDILNMLRAL